MANGAAIGVSINGANIAGVTASEGLSASDTNGTVISIAVNAANAGTIDRTANAIAGHIEIQITHGGVVDTCWMGTRKPTGWRALAGSSPYTVRATDDEFMVALQRSGTGDGVYPIVIPRALLSPVARNFVVDTQQPTQGNPNWHGVAVSINAAGTSLTVAVAGDSQANLSINSTLAR